MSAPPGTGGGMRIRLLKRGRVVKSYKVKPDTFTIGSGKEATIRAAGVEGLAPKHALVWLDDGIPTLVPSSGCTVRVNGETVQFARLDPDDVVTIGKLELQIAAVGAEGAEEAPQSGRSAGLAAGPDDDGPTMVSAAPVDPLAQTDAVPQPPARPMPAPVAPRPLAAPPQAAPPAYPSAFEPPRAPPPRSGPPPEPALDSFDDESETMVSRPVVSAGEEAPARRAHAPRPAPQPEIQHKPTTLGVPLPKVPRRDEDPLEAPTDEFGKRAAPAFRAPAAAPQPEPRGAPTQPDPVRRAAPVFAPEPPSPSAYYDDWEEDDDEDDELSFVEPFSMVDVVAEAGPPSVAGPREKYVVAQVSRYTAGKLWRVVTVLPGKDYRPDPSSPPLLTVTRDGRCTIAATQGFVGRVWIGAREAPLASFQPGGGGSGQATLSAGDHAVIDAPDGKYAIQVFRPPRLATPGFGAGIAGLGVLAIYSIGVIGLLVGLAFALGAYITPQPRPASASDEEQYELISQNDLTLIAPQNVDTTEEEPVEDEESDAEAVPEEVPPEAVPRTTRRASRATKASSGSSAASQLISALSTGGGGGASLRDVITNIDAVGSTSAGSALFRTSGIISKLPGGEVKIARRGGAGGVATLGGDALKASSPGIGTLASSGRTGKVRGSVSRVSSLMRASGGQLDRALVLQVINRHIGAITQCYERRLVANPGLSGRIVFNWRISESGSVSGVSVRSSTISDAQVASCISGVIQRMRFPRPEGGPVSISFPFVFRAVDF